MTKPRSYQLEVKRRTRWVALPYAHPSLLSVESAMKTMSTHLRTGAMLRVRRSDGLVGPTYKVRREPTLWRRREDTGWRKL